MLYDYKRSQYSNQPLKVSDWEWLPEVSQNWESLGKPVIFGVGPTVTVSSMTKIIGLEFRGH